MQTAMGTAPTLINAIWPRETGGLLRLALLAIAGSALMAVSAKIPRPLLLAGLECRHRLHKLQHLM